MLNNKVLLTYKRKRFSYQIDAAHTSKEIGLQSVVRSGSTWICSPKSEYDPNDAKSTSHHSLVLGKCQCFTCNSRDGCTESMHQLTSATNGMIQCQITAQNDMKPMILCSNRVLSSTQIENNMKNIISENASGRKSGLDYITNAEGNLIAESAVHDQIGNPINLNVSLVTEGDKSECTEIGTKMSPYSYINDNVSWNGGHLKEHSVGQLLTFSRRVKLKQDAGERTTERNLKTVDSNSVSRCSSHVTGAHFSSESSSQKQVDSSHVPHKKCVVPSSHVETANEMANLKVDCTAEVCSGSKITQKFEASSVTLPTVTTREESSDERFTVQPVDVKNCISFSSNSAVTNLNISPINCENITIPLLSERDSPSGLDLSAVPTSNKRSNEFESFRDSQSPSTPSCSLVITDDENDARNKEIEWLESLENTLMERKKSRGAYSSMARDGVTRREGLSSAIPNNSAEQSVEVQDKTIDFVTQLTSFPQKTSWARPPFPNSMEKQKAETPAPFTDFLSRYFPSNPDVVLDMNSAAASSSSNSHFRDKLIVDRKLPYPSKLYSSLFKHKITEKAIADLMSSGKRTLLFDEPKRLSIEWTDEELDYLWIGVRRHGINNWNAILGDTKLQFVRSRFPEDLAVQWEQEQKKLFNGILFPPPANLPKLNTTLTHWPPSYYPATAETRLSLGDVYLHSENAALNSQLSTAYPSIASMSSSMGPLQASYLSPSPFPGAAMRHKKTSGVSRGMCSPFWERSGPGNDQMPPNTNLPHWLKEACISRPADIPWLQFFASGNANSAGLGSSEITPPSKDLRGRGILKRKSMLSRRNASILKIEESSPFVDESTASASGVKPSVIPVPTHAPKLSPVSERAEVSHRIATAVKSENVCKPALATEFVVIDSDVSSEETISDDQNMID